jgi:Thioesterase-like superfamily
LPGGAVPQVSVEAFFIPGGDGRWRPTRHVAGPWDPASQHAGPPAALLARELERCEPREDMTIGRLTCEILGAVPVDAELEVAARVVRPGRSVELLEAELSAGGRPTMRASAWRLLRSAASAGAAVGPPPPALPDTEATIPAGWNPGGYLAAVEWRFARGDWGVPGPAAAWTRLRVGLVDGEEPSPLQRVLAIADSGNGVSAELDFGHWQFINTDLTVHLHRLPAGEWVCLDARTVIDPAGVGLATSTISDAEGVIGRGLQSLYVAPR